MNIKWDIGTAYELFSSLYVIHDPAFFGVRPSWAAGVRSRIPADARELFSDVLEVFKVPIMWLRSLPDPKTASAAVERLESMSADEVLPNLLFCESMDASKETRLRNIMERKSWSDEDIDEVVEEEKQHHGNKHRVDRKAIAAWFDWVARPVEFGRRFVSGTSEYYENFFREEEKRISSALGEGLEHAKKLEVEMSQVELLEELSKGIKSDPLMEFETIVLIPSFWLSPFVMLGNLDDKTGFMQFGARPQDASLIPGDTVPDSLSTGLQAISDHTRLKILRLIAEQPLTQVEIAKKLRLRAPTINHHLKTLRMASLVTKAFDDEDPGNVRYSVRTGRVDELCALIKGFLTPS